MHSLGTRQRLFSDAIKEPRTAMQLSKLLELGAQRARGGLIVLDGEDPRVIADQYCRATGAHPTSAMREFFSNAEGFAGFCDRERELVFVSSQVSADKVLPVVAHEYFHLGETDEMRREAARLIAGRHRHSGELRLVLESAYSRIEADGELDNLSEYPAYLVESAVEHSLAAGIRSQADAESWLKKNCGERVAGLMRSLLDLVKRVLERMGWNVARDAQELQGYHNRILSMVDRSFDKMAEYAAAGAGATKSSEPLRQDFEPDEHIAELYANPRQFNPSAIAFTFAGKGAIQSQDLLDRFNVAKQMREQGRGGCVIWEKTGWYHAPDGFWRHEISDDKAEFLANPIKSDIEQFTRERLLEKFGDAVDVTVPARYQTQDVCDFMESLQIEFEESARPKFMYEVLHHPDLYRAYPSARYIRVDFVESNGGSAACYYEGNDRITITKSDSRTQMFSSLLHETQHAIQAREGWARGGNADAEFAKKLTQNSKAYTAAYANLFDESRRDTKELRKASLRASNRLTYLEVMKSVDALRRYALAERPSSVFRLIRSNAQWLHSDLMNDAEGKRWPVASDIEREFYRIPKPHRARERNDFLGDLSLKLAQFLESLVPNEIVQEIHESERPIESLIRSQRTVLRNIRESLVPFGKMDTALRKQVDRSSSLMNLYSNDIYHALHGEVEARNAQHRMTLSSAERRDIHPESTADVSADKMIVIFGGIEVKNPELDAAFKEVRNKKFQQLDPTALGVLGNITHNEFAYRQVFEDWKDSIPLKSFAEIIAIKPCHHTLDAVFALVDSRHFSAEHIPVETRHALGKMLEGFSNRDNKAGCSALMERLGYEQAKAWHIAAETDTGMASSIPPKPANHDECLLGQNLSAGMGNAG